MKYFFSLILAFVIPFKLKSQNTTQQTYWATFLFNKRLSPHYGFSFDAQMRSADDLQYLKSSLIRPGITYYFSDSKSATLGYANILTFPKSDNLAGKISKENDIWEQYSLNLKVRKISLSNRLRIEQRFVQQNTEQIFAQRLRFLVRALIPLQKLNHTKFTKGWYNAIQNEILLNVQNKQKLNNHFFDQNRTAVSLGYRFNPELDLELGFADNFIQNKINYTTNYVCQLAISTKFK